LWNRDFLAVLEKEGIEVAGVEFAESSQRVKFNGPLHVGRMEDIDIKGEKFDGLLMLNVMEHLDDPMYVLSKAHAYLLDGGVLVMRNPNSDLFFNPAYKVLIEVPKYLVHLALNIVGKKTRFTVVGFQNQHLFYFNKSSMRKMLEANNFSMEYFTTADPFNQYRFGKALKEFNLIEAGIAGIRHILGYMGLGPECIVVARRKA
jgi:2-polyprenyl-3-methyl-5-hydroxy-6-metoxy-1,4-benzoquinol methylase